MLMRHPCNRILNMPAGKPQILDEIDYVARSSGIEESIVQTSLEVPELRAAATAYANGRIPLGYAAYFAHTGTSNSARELTRKKLLYLIRYVGRRARLDRSDEHYIALNADWARAISQGFPRKPAAGTRRSSQRLYVGDHWFAVDEPWREYSARCRDHRRHDAGIGDDDMPAAIASMMAGARRKRVSSPPEP